MWNLQSLIKLNEINHALIEQGKPERDSLKIFTDTRESYPFLKKDVPNGNRKSPEDI